MGKLAARLLLQRLETAPGDQGDYSEIRVGSRLIERDFCRPA